MLFFLKNKIIIKAKKRIQEKDPYYIPPKKSNNTNKFVVNEFIASVYKKAAERMKEFSSLNDNELNTKVYRDSTLDKFYDYGAENQNNIKIQEDIPNIADDNIKIVDYISMAHEFSKENDPKRKYTEFRKKKNKDSITITDKINKARRNSSVKNETESVYLFVFNLN